MQEEDKRKTLQVKNSGPFLGTKKLGQGLKVDTKSSKPLYRWNVIRSKAEGPSTRSHSISFIYNNW